MDINLNIDAKELAGKITDALTNEAFSEMFKKAVDEELKRITSSGGWSGQNIIQSTVRQFFERKMADILEKEYSEHAKQLLQKYFEKNKLEELASEFVSKVKFSSY